MIRPETAVIQMDSSCHLRGVQKVNVKNVCLEIKEPFHILEVKLI